MAGRFARRAITVIVADDYPIVRDGIARAIDGDGIEVIGQVDTGQQTLELTLELVPDVLVIDLQLQDLSALEVIRRLQAERPEIKIIVMTSSEDAGPLLKAIANGASSYLSKGTTGPDLRQAVISTHAGGSVITPELTRHLLNELASRSRGAGAPATRPRLEERELDMLRLVVEGKTDLEIARALVMSPRTVQNHLSRIREKTGLKRRSELTRWAVEHAAV